MLAKLALSVLMGGASLALGAAPALAAAPGSSVPSGSAAHCGKWTGKTLDRLENLDTRLSTALPKLQAAEQKAQSTGHPKVAARLTHRIEQLTDRQAKVSSRIAKIEQRCPGLSGSNGSATNGPTTNG